MVGGLRLLHEKKVTPGRRGFDFPTFAHGLRGVPPTEVSARIQDELQAVEAMTIREPRQHCSRLLYIRSLERLLQFTIEGQLPLDLTPKERAAFNEFCDAFAAATLARR